LPAEEKTSRRSLAGERRREFQGKSPVRKKRIIPTITQKKKNRPDHKYGKGTVERGTSRADGGGEEREKERNTHSVVGGGSIGHRPPELTGLENR